MLKEAPHVFGVSLAQPLRKQHLNVMSIQFFGAIAEKGLSLAIGQDDVAIPADVDKVFRLAFGHSMGPLATADLIGLDTVLNSIMVLFDEYKDPKFRPCPLLQKMVDAGYLGRKSGRGFFTYTR